MRRWRFDCGKAGFAVCLVGVSLLIACNEQPAPQPVPSTPLIPPTAAALDAGPLLTADARGVEGQPPSAASAVAPDARRRRPVAAAPVVGLAATATEADTAWPPTPMVVVPAGSFRPFFPGKDEPRQRQVAAFQLDVTPVTVGAFLDFVRAHPTWRRGAVPRIFADLNYLRHWVTDLRPGVAPETVLTHVSWFAARAYCRARDKRLPTMQEWERAALASEVAADGREDPAFNARILRWYGHPARGRAGPVGQKPPNFFGLRDLHGLVWEWVEDFNTALVTGESRADSALERGLYCGAGSIGAADPSDYAAFMRFALRSSLKAAYTTGSLGFRCAADIPPGGKR